MVRLAEVAHHLVTVIRREVVVTSTVEEPGTGITRILAGATSTIGEEVMIIKIGTKVTTMIMSLISAMAQWKTDNNGNSQEGITITIKMAVMTVGQIGAVAASRASIRITGEPFRTRNTMKAAAKDTRITMQRIRGGLAVAIIEMKIIIGKIRTQKEIKEAVGKVTILTNTERAATANTSAKVISKGMINARSTTMPRERGMIKDLIPKTRHPEVKTLNNGEKRKAAAIGQVDSKNVVIFGKG